MFNSNRSTILGFVLCVLVLDISCVYYFVTQLAGDARLNHLKAMMALRQIRKAQATYKEKQGNYGSIDDLIAAKLIDSKMANKEFYGYSIRVRQKPNSYEAAAIPIKYGETGFHYFYLDESGIIRVSSDKGKEAGPSDPPIGAQ
jgi:hypothetical protein